MGAYIYYIVSNEAIHNKALWCMRPMDTYYLRTIQVQREEENARDQYLAAIETAVTSLLASSMENYSTTGV